jgi:hypothetical protein
MRRLTTKVELGLGGSYWERVSASSVAQNQYRMVASPFSINLSPSQTTPSLVVVWQQPSPNFNGGLAPSNIISAAALILGEGNAGTPVTDPSYFGEAGVLPEGGGGVTLDGVDDWFITFGLNATYPGITPASLEALFRVNSLPAAETWVWGSGAAARFGISLRPDGRLYAYYNGSAVGSVVLPGLGQTIHVALTRSGASPDAVKMYVNGVLAVSGTPARFSFTWVDGVFAGKHWTSAQFGAFTYYHLGVFPVELTAAEIALRMPPLLWTDVSADVRDNVPCVVERGIRDDSPTAHIAGPGQGLFGLDNSDQNSAKTAGYYDPASASCRSGFRKGMACRISFLSSTVGSTYKTQFHGRVRVISPTLGFDEQVTNMMAYDFLDQMGRSPVETLPLLYNPRSSDMTSYLMAFLGASPPGMRITPTQDIVAYGFNNAQDENRTALNEAVRTVNTDGGYLYTNRSGIVVQEPRGQRYISHLAVDTAFTAYKDIEVVEINSNAINRVLTTAHPPVTDPVATTVLYAMVAALPIGPGETFTFQGPYRADSAPTKVARIGGAEVVTPVPTTDYTMNTKADGTGTNLTAFLAIVANKGANNVELTVTNSSTSAAWITKLQIRGKGIYDFRTQTMKSEDIAAVASDGANSVSLDMPYQDNANIAQGVGDLILVTAQSTTTRARGLLISLNDPLTPESALELDVSYRVSVPIANLVSQMLVNALRIEVGVGGEATLWMRTVPAPTQNFWILGQAGSRELGINTRVFYA